MGALKRIAAALEILIERIDRPTVAGMVSNEIEALTDQVRRVADALKANPLDAERDKARAHAAYATSLKAAADESHWLQANTDTWQSMTNDTLIEVIDKLPAGVWYGDLRKLYLGEAIDWSTWATGPRRLKASIAMWRVLR